MGGLNIFKETLRTDGYFRLYKGYSALLFFSVPKNYTRFGFFQYFRDNVFTEKNKLNTFGCGLAAGAGEALFVVTPQETLKVKLIHDKLSKTPPKKSFLFDQ